MLPSNSRKVLMTRILQSLSGLSNEKLLLISSAIFGSDDSDVVSLADYECIQTIDCTYVVPNTEDTRQFFIPANTAGLTFPQTGNSIGSTPNMLRVLQNGDIILTTTYNNLDEITLAMAIFGTR